MTRASVGPGRARLTVSRVAWHSRIRAGRARRARSILLSSRAAELKNAQAQTIGVMLAVMGDEAQGREGLQQCMHGGLAQARGASRIDLTSRPSCTALRTRTSSKGLASTFMPSQRMPRLFLTIRRP